MKRWKLLSDGGRAERNRIAFQGGSYSLIATAVVLAILIALNILVSALPANLTKYDISASKLYSITSNTKVVVNALEEDVTIYWIVQSGEEDDVIETLLNKYDSLSDHITVVKKNPDVYPTFAEQYTSETVQNNSLVVECGERSRFIGYDDIYVQEPDIYSYSYNTSFDGEGAITSAIDYVVTEDLPQLYVVEGHGEQALPDNFQEQIEQEVEMLSSYAEAGGKLLVMAGPTEEGSLSNLYSLLSDYGVSTTGGIVVEGDREHYTGYPYVLLPEMSSHAITDPLMEEHYYPNMPISQGMTVDETAGSAVTVLLSTSEEAFSKSAGYQLTSYEKEEGDVDGPFAVGLSIDCSNEGQIVWFSSAAFLDDMYNALSSGSNSDLAMNALSSLIGESEAMAIRSKSLNYNYLSISDSTASLLKTLMIGVFPLGYLGIGVCVIVKRRREQHEAG
ncbi:MAG: Gldg family protein [Oscillospiraceae bacterium]|nr:Gldg family protein [Oscillospiraceae bacterium]